MAENVHVRNTTHTNRDDQRPIRQGQIHVLAWKRDTIFNRNECLMWDPIVYATDDQTQQVLTVYTPLENKYDPVWTELVQKHWKPCHRTFVRHTTHRQHHRQNETKTASRVCEYDHQWFSMNDLSRAEQYLEQLPDPHTIHSGYETTQNGRPVVIFVHGGAWFRGNRLDDDFSKVRAWLQQGYIVVTVDYRLSRPSHRLRQQWMTWLLAFASFGLVCAPFQTHAQRIKWILVVSVLLMIVAWTQLSTTSSTKQQHERPHHSDDVAAAVGWVYRHIDRLGGDPCQLILSGTSAGAHLAATVVCHPLYLMRQRVPHNAIVSTVLFSGPYSAREVDDHLALRMTVQDVIGPCEALWKYEFPCEQLQQWIKRWPNEYATHCKFHMASEDDVKQTYEWAADVRGVPNANASLPHAHTRRTDRRAWCWFCLPSVHFFNASMDIGLRMHTQVMLCSWRTISPWVTTDTYRDLTHFVIHESWDSEHQGTARRVLYYMSRDVTRPVIPFCSVTR